MGTRSVTIIMDGNQELVRIYRQYDGYPDGHGLALAKLADRTITNGISGTPLTHANGMGELAALIIAGLKLDNPQGNVYLEAPGGEISDWVEYVYIVRGPEGRPVTIECSTQTGPFPFNVQEKAAHVFTLTPKEVKRQYGDKPKRRVSAVVVPVARPQ